MLPTVPFIVRFVHPTTGEEATRLCLSLAVAHRLAARFIRKGVRAVSVVPMA